MTDFEKQLQDLHKRGNTPKQIAFLLGMPFENIWQRLLRLGLVKREDKRKPPPPMQTHRTNTIRQLDAKIQWHQGRARDLMKYRNQLASVQATGENLQQAMKGGR